jgi:hypothetical protein
MPVKRANLSLYCHDSCPPASGLAVHDPRVELYVSLFLRWLKESSPPFMIQYVGIIHEQIHEQSPHSRMNFVRATAVDETLAMLATHRRYTERDL